MDNVANDSVVVLVVTDDMKNCVRSHIIFQRWRPHLFPFRAFPGDQISARKMKNVIFTGHEEYSSCLLFLHTL